MKTFKRFRNIVEVGLECRKRGWNLDARKFCRGESDFVRINFRFGTTAGHVLLSMFNGRFFGELVDGRKINSDKTDHENEPWFQELLGAFYSER